MHGIFTIRTSGVFIAVAGTLTLYGCFVLSWKQEIQDNYYTDSDADGRTCPVPGLASLDQYNKYINTKQANCDQWGELGGTYLTGAPDGRKLICLDPRFNIQSGRCTVLSFGVNNEWSFEDDAEKLGCKVFAFDPTMGVGDHQRSDNIQFFSVGISNYKGRKNIGMNLIATDFKFLKSYPVERYINILDRLGLRDQIIDFIKMDIERSEIDFLQDIIFNTPHLLKNIKQIAMEVHHDILDDDMSPMSSVQVFWPYYHLLRCHGFKIIHSRFAGFFREVIWARVDNW